MRRVRFPSTVFMVSIVVAACSGATGTPGPTSTVSPTASAIPATPVATDEPATGTPPPTEPPAPTDRPTPTPVLGAPCPTASPLQVFDVLDADPECFQGDFSVTGWLDFPPAMGWEGPLVQPAWLYYPPDQVLSAIWSSKPIEPDHMCAANLRCGWFFVHLAPGSTVQLGRTPQYVVLTGHRKDPASATCHYVPEPSSEYIVHDEDAVQQCETQFVVTSIKLLGAKPA